MKPLLCLATTSLLALLSPACSENPVAPQRPEIVAGPQTELAIASVQSSGGVVSVNRPGDPLDGLEIEVPVDAYDDTRTFRIATSPIERHDLGEDFNPITPLISISNGGDYSESPMLVTIPVTIPDGHFAMAFVYDRATRSLEGLPLASYDDASITVMTSNFTFSGIVSLDKRAGGIKVGESEIVVSSIPETKLNDPYNSGFVPGIDDWQFTNYGSHAAPGGQCAGQSSAAMWYFSDRKGRRGDQPLNGRFDNDGARTTPKVWADDVAGYRFCSIGQVNLPWDTWLLNTQHAIEGSLSEKVTYNLFAYSIRLTKQPQFVHVRTDNATEPGHAMIVYKISNGNLYIADPNYPGRTDRFTEFSLGHFLPYHSGPTASQLGVAYKKFYYLAQSSIVNSSMFKERWGEVIDGTIGQEAFPSYSIHARASNGQMISLSDGFETATGILEFDVRLSDIPLKVSVVHNANQDELRVSNGIVKLPFGEHLLGFHVTDASNRWVGFEWIRVVSKNDATTDPPITPDETGTDCSAFFTIDSVGTLVTQTVYSTYPDGRFEFTGHFPGGFARMVVKPFGGTGNYALFTQPSIADGGSYVSWFNGSSWFGAGTMSITRWDAEKVAGTFVMQKKDGSGTVVDEITGEFQCNR